MIVSSLALWTLMACDDTDRGCLDRDLEAWCFHEMPQRLYDTSTTCEELRFEAGSGTYRCGDVDYERTSYGFGSETHYFDHGSGELIAVEFTKDVNTWCGGYAYWYGRRVDLDRCELCTYDPESPDGVPVCD